MKLALLRVSARPSGWSVCHVIGRRRPVMAWAIFAEDRGPTTVGMVARGETLVRGDRVAGFVGYAAGPGCESQLEPPALPPSDLDDAMSAALEVHVDRWDVFEAGIRKALEAAANVDWASVALAGFALNPSLWFRLWLRGRREHERTEADLMQRLRALSLVAPGRSLEEALSDMGVSLGALIAAPDPPSTPHEARRTPGRGEGQL